MTPGWRRHLRVAGGLAVFVTACEAPATVTSAQVRVVLVDTDVAIDQPGLRDLNWGDPRYFIEDDHPDGSDNPDHEHATGAHGTELARSMAVVLGANTSSPAIEIDRYVVPGITRLTNTKSTR